MSAKSYRWFFQRLDSIEESKPILSIDGPIATIFLNRPSVHNRIQSEDVVQLRDYFNKINADTSIRVAVFCSAGASFSSGYDLNAFGDGTASTFETQVSGDDFEALGDELEQLRPITIARLHAPLFGGATDLALACDFRLGADTIHMLMPAAKIGIQYYGHGLRRWVCRLGLNSAKELFLTAKKIDAAQMLNNGFLTQRMPVGQLDVQLQNLIDSILILAPLAVQGMKQVLNDCANANFDDDKAKKLHLRSRQSEDMLEALRARKQKRSSVFKGR
jgi:enoyl-CoA hydratase